MKNHIILFLLFIQFTATAQLENTLLWKITSKELDKPSYLYGTIHHICDSVELIKPKLQEIIKSSDKIYFEIVFDEVLNDFKLRYNVYLKNGKKLSSYYTASEFALLEKTFDKKMSKYNQKLEYYQGFKPDKINVLVLPDYVTCFRWTSYEKEIAVLAKKNKVQTQGLETFEEHYISKIESDSTTKIKAKYFFDYITDQVKAEKNYIKYLNFKSLYYQQNIEELHKASVYESSKSEIELALDFRNKLWIPRIAEASKKGQMLYAFGAAHLAGENGVINLLRKEGFTVTPVFE